MVVAKEILLQDAEAEFALKRPQACAEDRMPIYSF
jgi:hypothetical protein